MNLFLNFIIFSPIFKINDDKEEAPEKRLVIIQCDSGHLNGDLIACARYRIYDIRAKADDVQITHVLFIIHLPQQVASSSFVGFQGDPWISSHIDDLRPTSDRAVSANEAIGLSISELFLGQPRVKTTPLESEEVHMSYSEDVEEDRGDGRSHSEEMPSASDSEGNNEYQQDERPRQDQEDELEEILAGSWEQPQDKQNEERTGMKDNWAERVQNQQIEVETEEMILSSQAKETAKMTVDDIEAEEFEFEGIQAGQISDDENITDAFEVSPLDIPPNPVKPIATPSWGLTIQIVEPHHTEAPRSPLFRRLHGCIQAAASRLKDSSTKRSTKRVEILVHLIPKEPPSLPGLQYLLLKSLNTIL